MRAFLFVTTIKYREPEKSVVPAIRRGGEYCVGVFFLSAVLFVVTIKYREPGNSVVPAIKRGGGVTVRFFFFVKV